MVERVVLVIEVRLEDGKSALVVVVSDRHAHTPLLAAVLIDRRTGAESDLFERAVSVVVIQKRWRRIVRHIDIYKSIIVKVAADHSHAIIAIRVRHPGLF